MPLPLVSICIPTYYGAQYLQEALDSVKAQTFGDFEVVISDDASQDDTLKIVTAFKNSVDFPVHIYQHTPKGIGANWNYCVKKSNGKYIKFLFQDDALYPNCIEEMAGILNRNVSIGMISCKRTIIYENDYNPEVVSDWLERFENLQKGLGLNYKYGVAILDHSLFKHKQFLRSPLNKVGEPSAFMFRRDILNRVGYFKEDLKQILDYEFCYRVLKTAKIAIINKPLVKFRLHEMQATNINRIQNINRPNKVGKGDNYSKILYKGYLNYVDDYTRLHLLKKHNFFYKVYYFIKIKIKK